MIRLPPGALNTMKARHLRFLAPLLLGAGPASFCACSSAEGNVVYIHPLADFTQIQRVAVLPLENLAGDQNAGEWVRQIITNEMLAQGMFDVVEPWEVNRILLQQGITEVGVLSKEDLKKVAGALEAQALMVGTVLQFSRTRSGNVSAPEIALSLRLVDVETGLIVWSSTYSVSGISIGNKLVGTDGPDLTAATATLVRDLLGTISS